MPEIPFSAQKSCPALPFPALGMGICELFFHPVDAPNTKVVATYETFLFYASMIRYRAPSNSHTSNSQNKNKNLIANPPAVPYIAVLYV